MTVTMFECGVQYCCKLSVVSSCAAFKQREYWVLQCGICTPPPPSSSVALAPNMHT
jgi:hypothetical protein